jgi:hypothetical protein
MYSDKNTAYSDTPAAKHMREQRLKKRMLDPSTYSPAPVSGRWKPGESGNPKGRPKRLPLAEAQAALLDKFGNLDALKAKLSKPGA